MWLCSLPLKRLSREGPSFLAWPHPECQPWLGWWPMHNNGMAHPSGKGGVMGARGIPCLWKSSENNYGLHRSSSCDRGSEPGPLKQWFSKCVSQTSSGCGFIWEPARNAHSQASAHPCWIGRPCLWVLHVLQGVLLGAEVPGRLLSETWI